MTARPVIQGIKILLLVVVVLAIVGLCALSYVLFIFLEVPPAMVLNSIRPSLAFTVHNQTDEALSSLRLERSYRTAVHELPVIREGATERSRFRVPGSGEDVLFLVDPSRRSRYELLGYEGELRGMIEIVVKEQKDERILLMRTATNAATYEDGSSWTTVTPVPDSGN